MTDIVERLRKLADRERPYGSFPDTLDEAADEISRLRARNAELAEALGNLVRLVDGGEEEDAPPYLVDMVLDSARAAIAKAEKEVMNG